MPADTVRSDVPVVIVYGADAALVSQALTRTVAQCDGDGLGTQQGPLTAAMLADCSVAPMFAARRLVVARSAQGASADTLEALVAYAADPSPTATVVLEWSQASLPAALRKAVKEGHVVAVDANPPRTAGDRTTAIVQLVRAYPVSLDNKARALLIDTVGEDIARVESVLAVLSSTFPEGAQLSETDVAPYLGVPGSVPPWDLTDAISEGDINLSLVVLHRLMSAGGRHPLVILSILRSHFERIFTVAAAGVTDEKAAAKLLGLKGSSFPAKKAIGEARRLGPAKVEAALGLLAPVDDALKGGSGLPGRTVMEIVVARLAQLHRR